MKSTVECHEFPSWEWKINIPVLTSLLLDCSNDGRIVNMEAGHSSSVFYTNLWFPLARTFAAPVVS